MKKSKRNTEIPLTDEELDFVKESISSQRIDRSKLPHYDNSEKARFFRYIKKNKAFACICVLLAVCMVTLLSLCVAFAVKKISSRIMDKSDYTIIIGDSSYKVKYKTAVRDGVLYIDMYKIAKYAEMTITGSDTSVKFTASKNNYLRFEDKSSTAVISGSMVDLGGTAVVTKDTCEIPYDFLDKVIGSKNGLKLSLDNDTNTVKIQRRMYKTEDKDAMLPVEILLNADSFEAIISIVRPSQVKPEKDYGYSIDVSPYLANIVPLDAERYLLLANKQTPLGADYKPSDLVKLECKTADNRELYLSYDAARALQAMMLAMSADGVKDVSVTSAYRAYSRQKELFEGYVKDHMAEGMTEEQAIEAALEYSARAGTSEHQTGLCIDFITSTMRELDESFENTKAFEWLSANAYKYGFILRYPADKVDTTGYKYEPWHYRFVGRDAAEEIYNSGLCFEEYLTLN
ncbi:MAG: M15 family metallopeptidase [Clostridia bacterium]|nr:M15 family metallopeptidase [Clostridia bacterium]